MTDDEEVDEKPAVAAKAKPKRQRSKPSKETVTVEDDEEEDEHSVDEAEFAAVNEGPVDKVRFTFSPLNYSTASIQQATEQELY